MTFKEIQELIKLVNKTDLSEFKLREADFELSIRTKNFAKKQNVTQLATSMPIAQAPAQVSAPVEQSRGLV